MTLVEAIAQWVEATARDDSAPFRSAESRALSLAWLARFAGKSLRLAALTPALLRDFLARWFIENASVSTRSAGDGATLPAPADDAALMDGLVAFMTWAGRDGVFAAADQCLAVINELRERVPRARMIGARLAAHLAAGGGAFGFPEFLTSFEAGGQSQYDLDTAGEPGCMEGYFRITRVEGSRVEAEEILTETHAWPILFPAQVAALLENDYIINMELVLAETGWRIAACGFAYPPGTEV